ncbi:hypothetical protein MSBR3_3316 [Methanosarcina barkeri 3]|uniref:Uncharacterized protein n=2 Tax=Methanosarcina barkeri TaxID=2208 RepID=A0A0E3WYF8_METBA|nr:hypothetical protein MSBR3_3316 [Methanosarcina barkeri 3]
MWDLFTKREEYDPVLIEKYESFSYYINGQKNSFESEVPSFLAKNGMNPECPKRKKFVACLTYDINFVCLWALNTASRNLKALKKGHFLRTSTFSSSRVKKVRSLIWSIRQIIELEDNYGIKFTFYFRTLGSGNEDHTFNIEELEGELCHISDQGFLTSIRHGGLRKSSLIKLSAIESYLRFFGTI